MTIFIILIVIFEAVFNFWSSLVNDKGWFIYNNSDALIQGIFLICSVLYLRYKINQIENLHTNIRLITIHIVNFIVYSILVTVNEFFDGLSTRIENERPDDYKEDVTW